MAIKKSSVSAILFSLLVMIGKSVCLDCLQYDFAKKTLEKIDLKNQTRVMSCAVLHEKENVAPGDMCYAPNAVNDKCFVLIMGILDNGQGVPDELMFQGGCMSTTLTREDECSETMAHIFDSTLHFYIIHCDLCTTDRCNIPLDLHVQTDMPVEGATVQAKKSRARALKIEKVFMLLTAFCLLK